MDEGNRFQAENKNNLGTFSAINKIGCRTIFSFITISKQIIFLSKNLALLSHNNKSISKELKNHGSFLALWIGLDFMPSIVMVGYKH